MEVKLKKTIAIDYLENAFEKEEFVEIERTLQSIDCSLVTHSHPNRYIASFEELFANISILLSPDIVQAICLGLATNGVYDTLKATIMFVYEKLKVKKFTKIQGGKIDNNAIPNIHLILGKAHIILPMAIDVDKFKYFVDKVFDSIDSETVTKECFSQYDESTGKLTYYSEEQIVRKFYSDWVQKQNNRNT